MSINPYAGLQAQYIGAPFLLPGNKPRPPGESPGMVPTLFQWATYGVNQANPDVTVSVNLGGGASQSNQTSISTIRGVYIDNTGSDGSVYVYFPDTQFTVTCAPFETAFSPVLTNSLMCLVAGRGFGTNDASQTRVFFMNEPVPFGSIEEIQNTYPQWRASPQLSRGLNQYSAGYASPAIGDQWQYQRLQPPAGIKQIPILNTPFLQGGIITLTDFSISRSTNANNASGGSGTIKILSLGASGTLYEFLYSDANVEDQLGVNPQPVVSKTGLQYKLNASENWVIQSICSAAFFMGFDFLFGFSYQGPQLQTTSTISTLGGSVTAELISPATPYLGVRFSGPANATISQAQFQTNGSFGLGPVGTYHCEIWSDNGANPAFLLGSSVSIAPTIIFNGHLVNTWLFTMPVPITANQKYWLILVPDNPATNQVAIDLTNGFAQYDDGYSTTITGLAAGQTTGGDQWCFSVTYTTL